MNVQNDGKIYDVVVVGGGLAALQAAITAAQEGSEILLVTKNLFGGSSFYPNTWGLGMVGPDGKNDADNFIETIMDVGCQINDKEMVSTLVNNHKKTIDMMESLNIPLLEAKEQNQKDFIPCFDYKKRFWLGLEAKKTIPAYKKLIDAYNITVQENQQLLDLIVSDNKIKGIIVSDKESIQQYTAKSVILATGGLGNVFKQSLNTSDVTGISQYLALKNGAELINLEFQQMMFGYISPAYKTIYNEKVFRYTDFYTENGLLFSEYDNHLLEKRSEHGPFTSQRDSRHIDLTIMNEINKGNKVYAKYKDALFESDSEFVKNYFKWMKETKNVDIKSPFLIDMFYHAANGGIRISQEANTSIEGLFACGEVTGGIHGADRIGGLTTTSALVFGNIAGKNASRYANKISIKKSEEKNIEKNFKCIDNADALIKEVQALMQENVLVIRNEENLLRTIDKLEKIEDAIKYKKAFDVLQCEKTIQFLACLNVSKAITNAALIRKESRGSHYREDYPQTSNSYNKRIISKMIDGKIITKWEI